MSVTRENALSYACALHHCAYSDNSGKITLNNHGTLSDLAKILPNEVTLKGNFTASIDVAKLFAVDPINPVFSTDKAFPDYLFTGDNIYYYLSALLDYTQVLSSDPNGAPRIQLNENIGKRLAEHIKYFVKLDNTYVISDINCIDLLYRLYNTVQLYREKSKKQFIDLLYATSRNHSQILRLEYQTEDKELRFTELSNAGVDIWITKLDKQIGTKTFMYDTGIKVKPPYGYYVKLFPRSSIHKTGYILANSVGIVDANYRGNLKVLLIKIDETMPDLSLPYSIGQLILEKQHYFEPVRVESINDETNRGVAGFGSYGNN